MMKITSALLLLLLVLSDCTLAEIVLFDNVNVIPMDREGVLSQHRVLVKDGVIIAIESVSKKLSVDVDVIIEGKGQYLMPGFSDTHYHQSGINQTDFDLQYKLLIANGITNVLCMGELKGQDTIDIRARAGAHNTLAPYYFTTGPMLEKSDLKTPDAAVKTVRFHKARGYDFIKIHSNLSAEVYLALLREAEIAGIAVIGHAQRELPLEYSLRMASIAHMEEFVMVYSDEDNLRIENFDKTLLRQITARVKDSGVYVAPTLSIVKKIQQYSDTAKFERLKNSYESSLLSVEEYEQYTAPGKNYLAPVFSTPKLMNYVENIIHANGKLTLAFYKAGIPLLVGSDNFGLHTAGFSFHDEMEAMNDAGIPAYEILKAATVTSSRYLKRTATAGTITPGKNAELILLAKNPLEDISNTRQVSGVMLKGRWFDKSALQSLLKEVEVERARQRNLQAR
ncbi:hypothetical protein CBP51_05075 [Cellvibrio mixtus]|uniref:Amidohydrolase-related domain-containing protein n=1 Tax=Cellvibrio mixtus TaxID=39650 RepID=A0A266Q973_9GAMM|nr:amidohydrolase family protein [Cellvibrio mixtus]OZY86402.1 hypothetical protein CBP51_05075 [Cellvibrio mixtus]